jgi:tetratricopeptide (TPR) repeat protein
MAVPDIERNMNEVLTRDPGRDQAAAYTVLGRLYFRAPPRPLSVGDDAKAESYVKKGIELVPFKVKNYLYLAEMYVDWKRYDEALRTIETAERLQPRPAFSLEDRFDQKELKALKDRLLARMKK